MYIIQICISNVSIVFFACFPIDLSCDFRNTVTNDPRYGDVHDDDDVLAGASISIPIQFIKIYINL